MVEAKATAVRGWLWTERKIARRSPSSQSIPLKVGDGERRGEGETEREHGTGTDAASFSRRRFIAKGLSGGRTGRTGCMLTLFSTTYNGGWLGRGDEGGGGKNVGEREKHASEVVNDEREGRRAE